MINLKKRLKRLDVLDIAMVKLASIIVGVILATYLSSLRGFVEQNILVVIFLLIVVSIRPVIRYWK
jgi:hypothetical protein